MKVCLLQDVPKTGKRGELIEVSEGFGRYLIAQKQASYVTVQVVKQVEHLKLKEKEKNEKDLQQLQEMAARLDGGEVEIETSQKKGGAFYSAVSVKDIAKAIKNQLGVAIKPDQIRLLKPIKEAGDYDITIAFKHGLEAEVKLIVS